MMSTGWDDECAKLERMTAPAKEELDPATLVNVGDLIWFPESRYGRPCLAGTGMSVYRCVWLHRMGMSPEEMHEQIEHIPLSHFYAAMAFYFANQEKVDAYLEAQERHGDELYAQWLEENPDRPAAIKSRR
jgi:uncharacterized protein (DUF433 family)